MFCVFVAISSPTGRLYVYTAYAYVEKFFFVGEQIILPQTLMLCDRHLKVSNVYAQYKPHLISTYNIWKSNSNEYTHHIIIMKI